MNREWRPGLLWIFVAVGLLIVYAVIAGGLLVLAEMGWRDTREIGLGELVESVVGMPAETQVTQTKTWEGMVVPGDSPEYVVREYFRALEARDVDRLFSLGSKAMMEQQMARRKTLSVEEFKAQWAAELDKLVGDIERVYGKGWSKMVSVMGATRINDRVYLNVTTGFETEPIGLYVVKEDGQWKMQTWIFN